MKTLVVQESDWLENAPHERRYTIDSNSCYEPKTGIGERIKNTVYWFLENRDKVEASARFRR